MKEKKVYVVELDVDYDRSEIDAELNGKTFFSLSQAKNFCDSMGWDNVDFYPIKSYIDYLNDEDYPINYWVAVIYIDDDLED